MEHSLGIFSNGSNLELSCARLHSRYVFATLPHAMHTTHDRLLQPRVLIVLLFENTAADLQQCACVDRVRCPFVSVPSFPSAAISFFLVANANHLTIDVGNSALSTSKAPARCSQVPGTPDMLQVQ
jgi:hypothetical protein